MRHLPPYRRAGEHCLPKLCTVSAHDCGGKRRASGPRMAGQTGADVKRRVSEVAGTGFSGRHGERRPEQLSGGQQQRVALARALINQPAVLLLDEPLGALDLKLRKQMQVELSRIQREVGITFVYVTHDQEEAMTMSDRIAVMNHGRDRTDRHPAGCLQSTGKSIRRRLHRLIQHLLWQAAGKRRRGIATVQLDAGRHRTRAAQPPLSIGQRVAVDGRPDDMQLLADHPRDQRIPTPASGG